MHATPDTRALDRPEHDAIVVLINRELYKLGWPDNLLSHGSDQRIAGLFAALHAVDATRYLAERVRLAGRPAPGWSINDRWTGDSIGWEPDQAHADALAAEQNELNADECAAALRARLDDTAAA
jgi:hypothetical protein